MLDKKLMQTTLDEIEKLRKEILDLNEPLDTNHPRYKSILNLKQYLILRSKDRTELQEKLFLLSLSSLGRSYAHVGGSIETLYEQLYSTLYCGKMPSLESQSKEKYLSIEEAIKLGSLNAYNLFGGKISSKLSEQTTAIMVTLPSNAVDDDGKLIHQLANAGVNAFRINTAHDDAFVWRAMADVIKQINDTRKEENKIKIFVDLAGPKIRTGKIRKVETPVTIGSNKAKKEIYIFASLDMKTIPEQINPLTLKIELAHIVVEKKFFKKLKKNATIIIKKGKKKKATITILELYNDYARAFVDRKVHLDKSVKLYTDEAESAILNIEMQPEPIRLFKGDILNITKENMLGHAAIRDKDMNVIEPALISCSFSGVFKHVKVGDRIFIDDGKIGLKVIQKNEKLLTCRVTRAKPNGTLLKEEKGINFPDTVIKTAALTQADKINALAVMDFADALSISFCQNADDVRDLQKLLKEYSHEDIAIVAKIETKAGVVNMPEILVELLNWQKSGVMIARGDLAIEVGFENLAHIQEALLDICNAAHVPVIWATQVLESLMKYDLPSRAEITDAAMAGRAECVMLNKGAFVVDTINFLSHILDDMHQILMKNRQLLNKETLWQH